MLEKVNFSCGHEAKINLSDDKEKRIAKIAELEKTGLCPDCRKAFFEEEDKKHSAGCMSVYVENTKLDKFKGCEKKLAGCIKDKSHTCIYVPLEVVCAEMIRKLLKYHNCSFDDAVKMMEKVFSKKYPELYARLKPVELDEDDLFAEIPVIKKTEIENPVIKQLPKISVGPYDPETNEHLSGPKSIDTQEKNTPVVTTEKVLPEPKVPVIRDISSEDAVIKPSDNKDFIEEFFSEFVADSENK